MSKRNEMNAAAEKPRRILRLGKYSWMLLGMVIMNLVYYARFKISWNIAEFIKVVNMGATSDYFLMMAFLSLFGLILMIVVVDNQFWRRNGNNGKK
jgi:hypothetical protein